MVVLCSMHEIYCLQLERFLCRECGKVKCSCEPLPAAPQITTPSDSSATDNGLNDKDLDDSDSVEYRNQKVYVRSNSGPEHDSSARKPPIITQRASEQPFVRSAQAGNGKLRRSFAVRSREGLENLLSFASVRKGHDQTKKVQN